MFPYCHMLAEQGPVATCWLTRSPVATGHLQQAQVRGDEESLRAVRPVRL